MAQERIAMDIKLAAAVADEGLNVADFCRSQGVSRSVFYKWRRRYREKGVEGLNERSRRPKSAAARLDSAAEDRIVTLRKRLGEDGKDNGPDTIWMLLDREGWSPVPSKATVWRVLRRRDLIEDQPEKRPRSSYLRFQYDRPNECWQIDSFQWALADGTVADVIDLIDDRSRLAPGSVAVPSCTTTAAWDAFVVAGERHGLPGMVLSDNGLAFSGKRRGISVAFEVNLRALGIRPVCSSPFHPQTCGKVERFHQTVKKWVAARPQARTIEELQHQLDEFYDFYNHRPHRALDGATPAEVHASLPHAGPAERPLATPTRITTARVSANGTVTSRPWRIRVGLAHIHKSVTVIVQGDQTLVFDHDQLLVHADLDPNRPTQTDRRTQ